MALKALIFDVDGTMADTELRGHLWAFNETFKEAGLPFRWDVETYRVLLGVAGGERRIKHFIEERPDVPDLDLSLISQLHRRKTDLFAERVRQGQIPWRAGVVRLIREAVGSGLKVGIATTTQAANVHELLVTGFGQTWPNWIDTVCAGGDAAAKKPDPEVYCMALRRLAVNPDEAVAVEDSQIGLLAARAADISTVITTNDWTVRQDFQGAMAVLNGLGEPWSLAVGNSPEGRVEALVDCARLQKWLALTETGGIREQ